MATEKGAIERRQNTALNAIKQAFGTAANEHCATLFGGIVILKNLGAITGKSIAELLGRNRTRCSRY